MSPKIKATAEVDINVYFNLIHNILCNHFGVEQIDNLERKSAYVPMSIPAEFQGDVEASAGVYMMFGKHKVYFDRIEELLREHYQIPASSEVRMKILVTGELHHPVNTHMELQFEEEFE